VRAGASFTALRFVLSPDYEMLIAKHFDLSARSQNGSPSVEHGAYRPPYQPNIIGEREAPIKLTVFTNFACPFSRQFAKFLQDEIYAQPDVAVEIRQLPLNGHPWARRAAEASVCLAQQKVGLFERFHDAMFEAQEAITESNADDKIENVVRSISGVDIATFSECKANGSSTRAVDADVIMAT
jgi:protein-disulfide isomerase